MHWLNTFESACRAACQPFECLAEATNDTFTRRDNEWASPALKMDRPSRVDKRIDLAHLDCMHEAEFVIDSLVQDAADKLAYVSKHMGIIAS